mgnify:CR=1 FL=1
MNLLFDQNLSSRLVAALASAFPGSRHVRDLGLDRADDQAIWQFAAEHGCVIVSKDTDFIHRALLLGAPPKVVFVRVGNCRTSEIQDLLVHRAEEIRRFLEDPVESLLTLASTP